MPTKTPKSPAESQATPITEQPKPRSKKPDALSKFARQIYEQVKDRLEREIEGFLEDATLEEARFMIEVLNDRSNYSMSVPRRLGEYEIPIYSAIQRQLDGSLCVVVPNDDMVPKIEQFIAAMEKNHWKKKPLSSEVSTEEQIRDRHEEAFRSEFELFARDAGLPSLRMMHDILARWNELARDTEIKKLPNTLAIAVEIGLDKLRAENAAEAAKKE